MRKLLFAATAILSCLFVAHAAPAARTAEEADLLALKQAFLNGSYAATQDGLRDFLGRYPDTRRMDEVRMLMGKASFYQNNFPRALDEFTIVSGFPGSSLQDDAVYWMGEAFFAAQDFKQAIGYFQRIIDEFRSSRLIVFAHYSKGWSYYMLDDLEGAIESFREAAGAFPHDRLAMESRFKSGEAFYLLGRYQDALAEFRGYLEAFPVSDKTADAVFMCGEASFRVGDPGAAVTYFRHALGVGGKIAWRDVASYELARAALDSGDREAALAEFSLLYKNSASAEMRAGAILGMARSLTGMGRLDEARNAYDEAMKELSLRHRLDRVLYGRAEVEFMAKNYAETVRLCEEAFAKFPSSPLKHEFLNMLGRAHLELGDTRSASAEFEALARSEAPADLKAKALAAIGDIHSKESRYEDAIETFDKALGLSSKGGVAEYAQYRIGTSLFSLKRYEESALAFRSLTISFPGSLLRERALYMLAFAHFKAGDFRAAIASWQELLGEYPSGVFMKYALFYLAGSMYGLEAFSEARGAYLRIISQAPEKDDELAASARYRAAWCAYNMRDEKQALSEFAEIAKRCRHRGIAGEAAYWLGEYYYERGKFQPAEKQFSGFLKNFPESDLAEYAQFHLGLIAEKSGDCGKAAREFLKLGENYPGGKLEADADIRAADLLVKEGRGPDATRLYEAVAAKFPETDSAPLACRRLAAYLRKERRYDEAAEALMRAMSLSGADAAAQLQYEIGECFEEKGDSLRAKEEYLKIPARYPKDAFWTVRAELAAEKAAERLGQRR